MLSGLVIDGSPGRGWVGRLAFRTRVGGLRGPGFGVV